MKLLLAHCHHPRSRRQVPTWEKPRLCSLAPIRRFRGPSKAARARSAPRSAPRKHWVALAIARPVARKPSHRAEERVEEGDRAMHSPLPKFHQCQCGGPVNCATLALRADPAGRSDPRASSPKGLPALPSSTARRRMLSTRLLRRSQQNHGADGAPCCLSPQCAPGGSRREGAPDSTYVESTN